MESPHVLREYALIADGERGALVGPRGDMSWLCFPGWADDAVFAGFMGGRGSYSVTPRGRYVWGGYYEPGSLIWRSRWVTETGIVESRDALAFPGDPDKTVILRRVHALSGPASLHVSCDLAARFGHRRATRLRSDDGVWRGRVDAHAFAWQGAGDATPSDDGELAFVLDLEPGEYHDLVLVLGDDPHPLDADAAWSATETAWAQAVPALPISLAARDARHARAVLRGLTSGSGGMVAAATMALPERATSGRAYDYRFAWVRDQAIAGQAAARAGATDLLDSASGFLRARLLEHGPGLAPAYTVSGNPVPDEHHVDLPGYPGGADVAGNHANDQFQLDAFGETLLCLADADAHDRADADTWRAIELAAAAIAERWEEPDAGIWELENRQWVHSRLICAAGLRAIAGRPTAGTRAAQWLAAADELVAWSGMSVTSAGHWRRAPDDERIDAALLLPGLRGAVPPDDPRTLATIRAVETELSEDFCVYRFRPDPRPLGEAEGAFLMCGFTMALAQHRCGRHLEAAHWFERSRGACGAPGLLTEEFDLRQRQLRGNLPQAFVHAMLLECAVTLSETIDDTRAAHT